MQDISESQHNMYDQGGYPSESASRTLRTVSQDCSSEGLIQKDQQSLVAALLVGPQCPQEMLLFPQPRNEIDLLEVFWPQIQQSFLQADGQEEVLQCRPTVFGFVFNLQQRVSHKWLSIFSCGVKKQASVFSGSSSAAFQPTNFFLLPCREAIHEFF